MGVAKLVIALACHAGDRGFDPRLSRTNNSRHCLELFFFNEGNPLEPCHIHVRKHGALAKYWIGEKVMLADNIGFSAKELREIESIIISNTNLIK